MPGGQCTMLTHRTVALDNLSQTIPPIDEDQKVALLHGPFKGTTLFRGEFGKAAESQQGMCMFLDGLSSRIPSDLLH